MPLLSVVVPVYGVEPYLVTCLDSILAEAGEEVEVVAVDDRSPDRCGTILREWARRDTRVRAVHLAANIGLGRARNAGLELARGDYIWFVDGDDWLAPGAVAAVRDRLASTRPDVLVVDHAEVFPDGRKVPGTPAGALAEPDRAGLLGLAHSACTKLVRRELLDELGLRFPPGWYEDTVYTRLLLLAAARIETLDRVCYLYRRRGEGAITSSVSPRHFEVFTQYDRLWAAVTAGGYERFRPQLFRLMVDHLLVIAGNDGRVPAAMRRQFFGRLAEAYRRWRPPGGYPVPGGLAGLKHRLVRANAYWAYAALRHLKRLAAWPGTRKSDREDRSWVVPPDPDGWRTSPVPAAPAPAGAPAAR